MKPPPAIIEIRSVLGTDGNYYRPYGFPRGVKSTGKTRLDGYGFQGGLSMRANSHKELSEKWEAWQKLK